MYKSSHYDTLIQCLLLGQMCEDRFFALMREDEVFNKYVQKDFARRRKELKNVY